MAPAPATITGTAIASTLARTAAGGVTAAPYPAFAALAEIGRRLGTAASWHPPPSPPLRGFEPVSTSRSCDSRSSFRATPQPCRPGPEESPGETSTRALCASGEFVVGTPDTGIVGLSSRSGYHPMEVARSLEGGRKRRRWGFLRRFDASRARPRAEGGGPRRTSSR